MIVFQVRATLNTLLWFERHEGVGRAFDGCWRWLTRKGRATIRTPYGRDLIYPW